MKNGFMTIVGVDDLDESITFYQKHLRCALLKRIAPAPGVEIAFLLYNDAVEIELVRRADRPPREGGEQETVLAFQTDDLQSAYQSLCRDNVRCAGEPFRLPSGIKALRFSDPTGNRLSLMEE